jgi:perosamine synthetase
LRYKYYPWKLAKVYVIHIYLREQTSIPEHIEDKSSRVSVWRYPLNSQEMIPINRPLLDVEEMRAVAKVIRSGILTNKSGSGQQVTQFESSFASYVGSKFAIAVNSGTAALHAALLAAGVGQGDEVIVPSFTFVATAEMVALTGARPIFVDIEPTTYCIDPEEVEAAITSRTKAIIPVHLYGLAADMDPIMELADDHNLVVIEDAAQAVGAEYKDKRTGSLGHIGCFSFYGSKNMVTGEGGMITTDNRELADTANIVRNHGENRLYQSSMLGHNYRMPELEAAIGYVQLKKLPKFLEYRTKNAKALTEALVSVGDLQLPSEPSDRRHGWYVYTVRLRGANAAKRNRIVRRIRERRIDCQIYYPRPVHLQPYYQRMFGSLKLPKTETAARQVFSLPIHPALSANELRRIVDAVKAAVR